MILAQGTENGLSWSLDAKGRNIYIRIVQDGTKKEFIKKYECQFEPTWGYDISDVSAVNKILDDMIEEILLKGEYLMDIKELNKYYRRTETENIHLEIFKESPEYKYYLLGVAQGIYAIYKVMSEYAGEINNYDWLTIIKNVATQDEKLNEYFNRLINAENKN